MASKDRGEITSVFALYNETVQHLEFKAQPGSLRHIAVPLLSQNRTYAVEINDLPRVRFRSWFPWAWEDFA